MRQQQKILKRGTHDNNARDSQTTIDLATSLRCRTLRYAGGFAGVHFPRVAVASCLAIILALLRQIGFCHVFVGHPGKLNVAHSVGVVGGAEGYHNKAIGF